MTPSRESLQYDSGTLQFLIKTLTSIATSLAQTVYDEINRQSTVSLGIIESRLILGGLFTGFTSRLTYAIYRGLAILGMSEDELGSLNRTLNRSTIDFPSNIGLADSESKGYRVWEVLVSAERIIMKRVIAGRQVTAKLIKGGTSRLAISEESTLVYGVDGSSDEMQLIREYGHRFQHPSSSWGGSTLFYIEQLPKGPAGAAKAVAESLIAPSAPLAGIKLESMTELRTKVKLPKLTKAKKAAALKGKNTDDFEVRVLCPVSYNVSVKRLKDIPEEERFFANSTPSAKWLRENSSSNGVFFEIDLKEEWRRLAEFNDLSKIAGLNIPSIILNTSRAANAEENLKALGVKPYFSSIAKATLAQWDTLVGIDLPILLEVGVRHANHSDGVLLGLAHLKLIESPIWDAIAERCPDSRFLGLIDELMDKELFNVNPYDTHELFPNQTKLLFASATLFKFIPVLKKTLLVDRPDITEASIVEFPAISAVDSRVAFNLRQDLLDLESSTSSWEKVALKAKLDAKLNSLVEIIKLADMLRANKFDSFKEYFYKKPSNEELLAEFEALLA